MVKPTAAQRREDLRNSLWPGSEKLIWTTTDTAGYTVIPRVLPLVMHLINLLAKTGDPSRVYLELWARAFPEGIVSVGDESAFAYGSGYEGARAVRTWRERIQTLRDLGFIKVASAGVREIAHILLLNPLMVCAELRTSRRPDISDAWWNAFLQRASEIGAAIPGTASARAASSATGNPAG